MPSHSSREFILKTVVLLLAFTAATAMLPSLINAQPAGKKLTKQDILDLLTSDVSSDDVAKTAQDAGISFPVTPQVEREIRAAGGTDTLINALKSLAPRVPVAPTNPPPANPTITSPPTLVIESNPGQSQVYVDDEPVGSTSQQGRLKLTRFGAGTHTVRVSLNGYQDFEQSITLSAGSETRVSAPLQKLQVAQINPPQPQPQQPQPYSPLPNPNPSGQPGYLGVMPMEQQPAGARGVVLSGADPNGPASQLGLKAYDTVLAVNGQAVNTPQALRATLSSHQAGEMVNITWYNGSGTVTRQARLAAYPNNPAPPLPMQQPEPQPNPSPSLNQFPHNGFQTFIVAHDHGQNGQFYCVGVMSIGNGVINYKGMKGNGPVHNFEIPLSTVKEARRNGVYLIALGGFHIKLNRGTNYNFVVFNQQMQAQPPDMLLTAIDTAMGR